MTFIDDLLNTITMYRLVLYYLLVVLGAVLLFSTLGVLDINPFHLLFSTVVILAVSWATHTLFATVFEAIPNIESVYITAFILALLITPVAPTDSAGVGFLVFASIWASASKYLFAIGKKHIFNPAAAGLALSALLIGQSATWWVGGNMPLLPIVLIGGLLITRKIRRFDLVIAFMVTALLTIALTATGNGLTAMEKSLTHSPIFFLGLVMLTEPLTMPPNRVLRFIYGAIVGFLFAPNVHVGSFYFTPELALLVGNLFVYVVSPKGRFMLTLVEKKEIAKDTYEFVFSPDRPLPFTAGQYLEWTLAHSPSDSRGNRRFFTIASSPTESAVRLGVKFYEPASSFKKGLQTLSVGDRISASQIAGDFVLPKDSHKKIVCIAGGIGVTPFRSHIQYLIDTHEARPIILFYSNKTAAEIAYKEVFDRATREIGLKTIYALTNEPAPVPGTHAGFISGELITKEVPDYHDCLFYISGPHGMVTAFQKTLRDLGVSPLHITTDYFPGFA